MSDIQTGAPSKYDPKYCELIIEHMTKGLSYESFAGVIGVTKKTLYNWEKVHPEFLHAKEVALEKARIFWEELGIQHIINSSESVPNVGSSSKSLNASVWIFNMKNRFGWRDKQPEEVDKININNFQGSSNDDLEKRARELASQIMDQPNEDESET